MPADSNSAADTATADTAAPHAADEIPLEVLEQQLTSWAANIAAAQARWLGWLAEYDQRQGWAEWGCRSAAHWLSWKCAMAPAAARERVRVAAALVELPKIRELFGQGRLSYSKVRALTRVANEFNEPELCDMALHATGAQLESICRGYRQSHPDHASPASAHERRRLTVRDNYDGTTTVTLVLPSDHARHVSQAINAQADQLIANAMNSDDTASTDTEPNHAAPTRRQVVEDRDGLAAVRADACVQLLTNEGTTTLPRPTDLTMVVAPHPAPPNNTAPPHAARPTDVSAETTDVPTTHVSAETPAAATEEAEAMLDDPFVMLQGEHRLANESARRLCCDPRITVLVENSSGDPLAVGRSTRLISHHLRLALTRRDRGRCQFPGCFATHNLHAHHIVHWADGGPTDLDNLVLVCHFHHHLIHDRGWRVDRQSRRFVSPAGMPLDTTPTCAESGGSAEFSTGFIKRTDRHGAVRDRWHDLEPPHLDPLDLGFATEIIHANEQARRIATT